MTCNGSCNCHEKSDRVVLLEKLLRITQVVELAASDLAISGPLDETFRNIVYARSFHKISGILREQ